MILERLADDLSAEFRVLRAPTIEYGVNAPTATPFPGSASLAQKTLHRLLNDLIGGWETGGVTRFIILSAHGSDPHLEAVSTLHTRTADVRTVDIYAAGFADSGRSEFPVHGGEPDTSLLLYIDGELVRPELARDYPASRRVARRYLRGQRGAIPADSPGSLGFPTRATVENGERLYHLIYRHIADRVFCAP